MWLKPLLQESLPKRFIAAWTEARPEASCLMDVSIDLFCGDIEIGLVRGEQFP
jgi:hypothetical protein